MQRISAGLLLLAFCTIFNGCASLYNEVDECLMTKHNKWIAYRAWRAHKGYWDCEPHRKDFGDGFREGYYDSMNGGGECPPTLPPRKYWSVHNTGPCSKEKTVAWYNGYAAGSMAAVSEGMRDRNRIVTASQIYQKHCQTQIEWPNQDAKPTEAMEQVIPPALEAGVPPEVEPSYIQAPEGLE